MVVAAKSDVGAIAVTEFQRLALSNRNLLDLVFADVKLPDMDGFELIRSIRPEHPNLPCVLVSGFYYNNDDAVQNALTDRLVIGYLSKPFLLDQFKRIIQLALTY